MAPSWEGGLSCGTTALYLRRIGSVLAAHRLSCSAACRILVPSQGIKPTSPAWKGGFLTTEPTLYCFFIKESILVGGKNLRLCIFLPLLFPFLLTFFSILLSLWEDVYVCIMLKFKKDFPEMLWVWPNISGLSERKRNQ